MLCIPFVAFQMKGPPLDEPTMTDPFPETDRALLQVSPGT